jgi:hypothetical protein
MKTIEMDAALMRAGKPESFFWTMRELVLSVILSENENERDSSVRELAALYPSVLSSGYVDRGIIYLVVGDSPERTARMAVGRIPLSHDGPIHRFDSIGGDYFVTRI